VEAVATSADGKMVISGDIDGAFYLWESRANKAVRLASPSAQGIYSVLLLRGDNFALSGHASGDLVSWDLRTRTGRIVTHSGSGVTTLALGGDGTRVITGHVDGSIALWDTQELGEPTGPLDSSAVRAAAFTPDGSRAFLLHEDGTHEFVDTSAVIRRNFGSDRNLSRAVALSHDGKRALCGYFDGSLLLWDTTTGEHTELPKEHEIWLTCVAANRTCQIALTGDAQGRLLFWTTGDAKSHVLIDGGVPMISALAVSADGEKAITGFKDMPITLLWVIGKPNELAGHPEGVTAAAISSDGAGAITGDSGGTVLWFDLTTFGGRHIGDGFGSVVALALSEHARLALCAHDSSISLLDVEKGLTVASFVGDSAFLACAVTEVGPRAFAVEESGRIHVLELSQ
jgi:WD40 repeat protein